MHFFTIAPVHFTRTSTFTLPLISAISNDRLGPTTTATTTPGWQHRTANLINSKWIWQKSGFWKPLELQDDSELCLHHVNSIYYGTKTPLSVGRGLNVTLVAKGSVALIRFFGVYAIFVLIKKCQQKDHFSAVLNWVKPWRLNGVHIKHNQLKGPSLSFRFPSNVSRARIKWLSQSRVKWSNFKQWNNMTVRPALLHWNTEQVNRSAKWRRTCTNLILF